MIIGIGNDLININRIENTLSKFGDRFIKRVKILKSFADSKEVDLYVENNVSIKENIFDNSQW